MSKQVSAEDAGEISYCAFDEGADCEVMILAGPRFVVDGGGLPGPGADS